MKVYAFGISIYFFVVRKRPFGQYKKIGEFVEAIRKKSNPARPSLKEDAPYVPPSLLKLAKLCWHQDPELRPSFVKIVSMLDQCIVESAVTDKHASAFWVDYFSTKEKVKQNCAKKFF